MNEYLYDQVIQWIPEGSRVLDLGTGYIDQIAYSAYYAAIGTVI